ncbi:dolichyl-diphosphooligosaccharide--protein glycosyltransferase 48 kDa subunit [Galendromus occidentalis]|uniref:Dolichyl-diphosphooligosaccharide--protein glycosyltransferase 48 kDa subunit n=1 Tax=Galendromus occidentalis TaxID=34638 RepID=A0AAJ6QPG1_9ACAR|nr:dolichyl-diphosphooligosaccharide--protein glycosyltransferase 48 kDa subunit [Galendromus occidentalis]
MKLLLAISLSLFALASAVPGETLVLVDSLSFRDTHSQFFNFLEERGYKLTFKQADDSTLTLKKYGEFLYKHLILFTPTTEEFGGTINVQALTEFIDNGGNVLAAVNSRVGNVMKELAAECGFEVDSEGNQMFDHHNYDVYLDKGDHTVIAFDSSQVIDVPAMIGTKKLEPMLFSGIGLITDRKNPLVTTVIRSSATAYSAPASKAVTSTPLVAGEKGALVASLQARNNARVLFSGSLSMFSNEYLDAVVKTNGDLMAVKSGNKDLVESLARWVFKETGVLRYSDVKHGGPYTVMDNASFSMKVEMLDNAGKWIPYDAPSIQLEFVRIDPFVRTEMKREANDGTYGVTFKVPDVYGVYRFKVDHRRRGYDNLVVASQVSVHPLQHTMYERFIPAAKPYYWSAFSMMLGLFVFSFVFIHHKEPASKHKKE